MADNLTRGTVIEHTFRDNNPSWDQKSTNEYLVGLAMNVERSTF